MRTVYLFFHWSGSLLLESNLKPNEYSVLTLNRESGLIWSPRV